MTRMRLKLTRSWPWSWPRSGRLPLTPALSRRETEQQALPLGRGLGEGATAPWRRFALLLLALLPATPARAQLFGPHGLDPKYCDLKTVRQTVVYVDDMMMYTGQTGWVPKLDEKLKGTLTPGERVTVVRLSPASGRSREEWSGCWPAAGPPGAAASGGLMSLFQADPVTELAGQRKYFFAGFGGALTRIYDSARRAPAQLDAGSPPQKQLLRALASDDGRFANSQTTIRAIVYSDMAENSDLGSAFKGASEAQNDVGARLGSYLRRGVFYGFGLGLDVADDPPFDEHARAFWAAALRSMTATVEGIDADLNVPNILPSAAYVFPVEMQFGGQVLDGRLSLLADSDGTLVDSWLGISRLGSAALHGTFVCQADGAGSCRLRAETAVGIATSAPSETLVMHGKADALSGTLGVKGQNLTFAVKTQGAE